MGATSRLPALLGRSRLPARPIPARADGGGPTPIFETLACSYGGYDGLIGWAFEDHGGPVSTAWAALCAGLDAPDFIEMQAALGERPRRRARRSPARSRNPTAAPAENAARTPATPLRGGTLQAGDTDSGTEGPAVHGGPDGPLAPTSDPPPNKTTPTWRSSRWRLGPSHA